VRQLGEELTDFAENQEQPKYEHRAPEIVPEQTQDHGYDL